MKSLVGREPLEIIKYSQIPSTVALERTLLSLWIGGTFVVPPECCYITNRMLILTQSNWLPPEVKLAYT